VYEPSLSEDGVNQVYKVIMHKKTKQDGATSKPYEHADTASLDEVYHRKRDEDGYLELAPKRVYVPKGQRYRSNGIPEVMGKCVKYFCSFGIRFTKGFSSS
jgi:hypothetical protein